MIRVQLRRRDGTTSVERALAENASEFSRSSAEWIRDEIREQWYPTSPSPRGGPPAKVSGNLDNSITVRQRDAKGRFAGNAEVVSWTIAATAYHAEILEDKTALDRPFFQNKITEFEERFNAQARHYTWIANGVWY